MKNLSILFIAFFFQITLVAQAPDTLWTKTFGGIADEKGSSVFQTSDGGFIITGFTYSNSVGGNDVWLIKTDSSGDTLWTRTFGGSSYEWGASVQQTFDGGYIIGGSTDSFGPGGWDVWLIKTDFSGNLVWDSAYGASGYDDLCREAQPTSDGGYIITGKWGTNPLGHGGLMLIKTDSLGNEMWSRGYSSGFYNSGYSLKQTSDGGYIIVGGSADVTQDLWLLKTDTLGDTIWTKKYGGPGTDTGFDVQQTEGGDYIITGAYSTTNQNYDVWLLKVDSFGDTLWTKTFGGSQNDEGYSIDITSDGGYIIGGYTHSYGSGEDDFWIIKTDATGTLEWEKIVGGTNWDWGESIQQTSDGGFIITGVTESFGGGGWDVWLIKLGPDPSFSSIAVTSPNGGEVWVMNETEDITWTSVNVNNVKIQLSIDSGANWSTIVDSIQNTGTYSWNVNATTPSTECLIKISNMADSTVYDESDSVFTIDSGVSVDNIEDIPIEYELTQNFPNPFNPKTIIKYEIPERSMTILKLFDVIGSEIRTLVEEEELAGIYQVELDASALPSGVYFYQLKAGDFVETKKMMLMK